MSEAPGANPLKDTILDYELEQSFLQTPTIVPTVSDFSSGRIQALAIQLLAHVDGVGVGLAANQIGYSLRVAVADIQDGKGMQVFINPEIVSRGEELVYVQEGCLSALGKLFVCKRYKEVTISYLDLAQVRHQITLDNFGAIVIQHEIDHLDGILIPMHGVPILATTHSPGENLT